MNASVLILDFVRSTELFFVLSFSTMGALRDPKAEDEKKKHGKNSCLKRVVLLRLSINQSSVERLHHFMTHLKNERHWLVGNFGDLICSRISWFAHQDRKESTVIAYSETDDLRCIFETDLPDIFLKAEEEKSSEQDDHGGRAFSLAAGRKPR